MMHLFIRYISSRGLVYLQCDSEDEDSEDNCSIRPVPKNLDLNKTGEKMCLGDNA